VDCKTVRNLLDEPALSEDKMIELEEHIETCEHCKAEYSFYINFTIEDELTFLHPAPLSKEYESISVSDQVMQRIWRENKWADPVNRGVRMTRTRRVVLALMAFILLMAGAVPLIVQWKDSNQAAAALGDNSTADTLLPVNSLKLSDTAGPTATKKIEYGVIDSTSSPVMYNSEDKSNNFTVNYGLLASLFGILVTVVSISWLLRHSDNTDRSM
jgi:hypothetical protein